MTVNLHNLPTEGGERARRVGDREHVGGVSKRLLTVEIHDRDQIAQTVMPCELSSLPDRTLVQLGVAKDDDCARAASLHPRRDRGAGTDREALPEGPGSEIDSGNARFRVHPQARTGPTEGIQIRLVEPSREHERREQCERRVPLREYEPISIVLVGLPLQHRAVENGEDLRNR